VGWKGNVIVPTDYIVGWVNSNSVWSGGQRNVEIVVCRATDGEVGLVKYGN